MNTALKTVIPSAVVALGASLLLGASARAGDSRAGRFELPAGGATNWRVGFDVPYPGTVTIVADWSPPRPVSFRIEGPEGSTVGLRRAGPPPQRFELDVGPEHTGAGRDWSVQIRALPSRYAAEGTITIVTPDRAEAEPARAVPEDTPPDPATPWREAYAIPRDAPVHEVDWLLALEHFRNAVVEDDASDSYRWQDGMLQHLASIRDGRARGEPRPSETTLRMLEEMAAVIREVDELRVSDDPLIAGPPPVDPRRRRAWNALRSERIVPIERSLNDLLTKLQRGHAPELQREPWSIRLVSALSACERHFDERVSVGPSYAFGADVVEEQWMRLLAAADVLERLGATAGARVSR